VLVDLVGIGFAVNCDGCTVPKTSGVPEGCGSKQKTKKPKINE
jgi:hypothetical protein